FYSRWRYNSRSKRKVRSKRGFPDSLLRWRSTIRSR
ncbi:hypothetical protein A5885_003533, partial [Enterococcus sp. 8E11_MSG4843]